MTTHIQPDAPSRSTAELQEMAGRHLWGHFSQLAPTNPAEIAVIERGDGCYVWDSEGTRYLDGLAGLFTVQAGHGRASIARAAATQAERLAYFPLWTYTHPVAIELAARLAALAPEHLNRVFFTTGGAEAVESAWKLARQYHRANGQPGRYKAIARNVAYHGTTMGALALTGVESIRSVFEPLTPGGDPCREHEPVPLFVLLLRARRAPCSARTTSNGRSFVRERKPWPRCSSSRCRTRAAASPPPPGYFERVREICDRHGVLLVSDEVICAFGRLGEMFGCQRVGSVPDMVTMAKGLTSGYAPLGGVMVSDRVAEPFLDPEAMFLHGITFGGHPVSCAVAMANLDVLRGGGPPRSGPNA